MKGIRGTDKRCYIVDLQGMTPRDANYPGEENHTCLVRHELLPIYLQQVNFEKAKEKMTDFEKDLEKEKEALLEGLDESNKSIEE